MTNYASDEVRGCDYTAEVQGLGDVFGSAGAGGQDRTGKYSEGDGRGTVVYSGGAESKGCAWF